MIYYDHTCITLRGINTFGMGVACNDAFDTAALRFLIREAAMSVFMEIFIFYRFVFAESLYFQYF